MTSNMKIKVSTWHDLSTLNIKMDALTIQVTIEEARKITRLHAERTNGKHKRVGGAKYSFYRKGGSNIVLHFSMARINLNLDREQTSELIAKIQAQLDHLPAKTVARKNMLRQEAEEDRKLREIFGV